RRSLATSSSWRGHARTWWSGNGHAWQTWKRARRRSASGSPGCVVNGMKRGAQERAPRSLLIGLLGFEEDGAPCLLRGDAHLKVAVGAKGFLKRLKRGWVT